MAAVLSQHRKHVLVVIDPWEVRVAMVAPIATVRIALLRDHPTTVATNRRYPWLRREEIDLVPVAPADLKVSRADLPELRRFAGSRHEKLINLALALAEQALTHALHEQLLSQNRSREAARAATATPAPRPPRRLPVPHRH